MRRSRAYLQLAFSCGAAGALALDWLAQSLFHIAGWPSALIAAVTTLAFASLLGAVLLATGRRHFWEAPAALACAALVPLALPASKAVGGELSPWAIPLLTATAAGAMAFAMRAARKRRQRGWRAAIHGSQAVPASHSAWTLGPWRLQPDQQGATRTNEADAAEFHLAPRGASWRIESLTDLEQSVDAAQWGRRLQATGFKGRLIVQRDQVALRGRPPNPGRLPDLLQEADAIVQQAHASLLASRDDDEAVRLDLFDKKDCVLEATR